MSALHNRVAARCERECGIPITPAGIAEIQRLLLEESDDVDLLLGLEPPHVREDGSCAHCADGWVGGGEDAVPCSCCLGRGVPL